MDKIERRDAYFYKWVVKWTARYLCEEYSRGIQKFQQALRTQKDGLERISPKMLPLIQEYLRDNHPGHRNEYEPDEEME